MKTAQHTPGTRQLTATPEWTAQALLTMARLPSSPDDDAKWLGIVEGYIRFGAAAPELIAACRTLADYYAGHEATDDQAAKEAGGGVYRALLASRAAIAKADG